MKMRVDFTKASGSGNDFVIVDNRDGKLQVDKSKLARALCSRHEGVGADGLLVIGKSLNADFTMEYYNADGTTGAMCGNGGRCVARYAFQRGIAESTVRFEVLGSLYEAEAAGENICLKMQDPGEIRTLPTLQVEGVEFNGFYVDTGAPHAVFFRERIDDLDVERVGRTIRHSPGLAPAGANVNFVAVQDRTHLTLRTYERGVEAETLACGTGAVGSALLAHAQRGMQPPIQVKVQSGETLVIHFKVRINKYTDVLLEGKATLLYCGNALYDPSSFKISTLD